MRIIWTDRIYWCAEDDSIVHVHVITSSFCLMYVLKEYPVNTFFWTLSTSFWTYEGVQLIQNAIEYISAKGGELLLEELL